MNLLVVVLLTVLWASILVPGAVRGRHVRSPISSVDSFERSMGILASETRGRLTPAPPGRHILVVEDPQRLAGAPSRRARALARRRMVLQGLIAALVLTAVPALLVGGLAVVAFVATALVLTAYVAVLAQMKAAAEHTRRTVRRLPVAPPAPHAADELPAADEQAR